MTTQKKSKLITEEILPQSGLNETAKAGLDETAKALEFYKTFKEISDITEKIDIALGRKKIYTYSSGSTKNFEIDTDALPPPIQSYTV